MQADNIRLLVDSINVFDENDITEKLSGLEGYKLKKSFLEEVYNTIIRKKKHFDPELGEHGEKIEEKVQRFINEIDYELREFRTGSKSKGKSTSPGSVVKIISKRGIPDIVRIFEAMKTVGMISKKTEVSQIISIYFNDPDENTKMRDAYDKNKHSIYREDTSQSRSLYMLNFIENIIENSYGKSPKKLNELLKFIDKLV